MDSDTPKNGKLAIPEFDGHKIRVTPDGRVVAIDILVAVGQKDPIRAWRNTKEGHPDIVEESSTFAFGRGGRSPEVLSEKGVYKLLMVAKGPHAARFREWVAEILQQVRTADERLTTDLIDRTNDPETLKRIEQRVRSKVTGGRLEAAMHVRGATKPTYAIAHDRSNILVTGSSSAQLRARFGTDKIRDHYSSDELVKLNTTQMLTTDHIENTDPRGHHEILSAQKEVIEDLTHVFNKYAPRGRGGPSAPLPSVNTDPPSPPPDAAAPKRPVRTPEGTQAGKDFFRRMKMELDATPDPEKPSRDNFHPWSKHLTEK